jgi:8-oxo-dGTP pyrophosphatase MutT (NUDIX family)
MTDVTVPARLAATILLVRDRPRFEVLMVKRHHQIDFASGALVFPGGKIEPGDADPGWAQYCRGWDAHPAEERHLRVAALREAFEESGVLLARDPDGVPWKAVEQAASERERIATGQASFLELVRGLGVQLDLQAMAPFARWITPRLMPKRFDTWFFIATAPEDQFAVCDGYETVDAEWIAPSEALRMAQAGERKIIFPTRMNLQLLAESSDVDGAIASSHARTQVVVEPWVELRDGERFLLLPPDAGYGAVAEPFSSAE